MCVCGALPVHFAHVLRLFALTPLAILTPLVNLPPLILGLTFFGCVLLY